MKKSLNIFFMSLTVVIFGLPSCYSLKGRSAKNEQTPERYMAVNVGPDSSGDPSSPSYSSLGPSHNRAYMQTKSSIPSFAFVEVPAGEFLMGTGEKQVQVKISKAFMIMETEVTQSQYFAVMGENPSYYKGSQFCDNYDKEKDICPDHPVDGVSWNDAQEFIQKLNELRSIKGCKGHPQDPSGCYRLPTEAEWVWAAGAGSNDNYFFGNDESELYKYAVYSRNSRGATKKVKGKVRLQERESSFWILASNKFIEGDRKPNRFGLYDVHGNVAEWCQDMYSDVLPGGVDPLVTDSVDGSTQHVFRGSDWRFGGNYLYLHNRDFPHNDDYYTTKDYTIGFRLVKTL